MQWRIWSHGVASTTWLFHPPTAFILGTSCVGKRGSVNRCRSRTSVVQSDSEPLRYQLKNNSFCTCIMQRRESEAITRFFRVYYASWKHRHNFRKNLVAVGTLKLDVSLNEERLGSNNSAHHLPRLLFVGGLDWPSQMRRPTICDIVSYETT
jgi:hypothetical protein